jgi:hypothetical protein
MDTEQNIEIGIGKSAGRFKTSEVKGKGNWIQISEFSYVYGKNPDGSEKLKTWEVVQRTTTISKVGVDGVQMIPIIKEGDRTHLLLIKCYRPPLDKFVIELPGGKF